MNLMRELRRRPWFKKSGPGVQTKIRCYARKYPLHMQSDMKWLDSFQDLEWIANVEELLPKPNERLYYTLVYTEKREGRERLWHVWVCS